MTTRKGFQTGDPDDIVEPYLPAVQTLEEWIGRAPEATRCQERDKRRDKPALFFESSDRPGDPVNVSDMRCLCHVKPTEPLELEHVDAHELDDDIRGLYHVKSLDEAALKRIADATAVPISWLDSQHEELSAQLEHRDGWRRKLGPFVLVNERGDPVNRDEEPPPHDELGEQLERCIEWLRSVVSSVTDAELAELADPERTLVLETRKHLWEYDRAKRNGASGD